MKKLFTISFAALLAVSLTAQRVELPKVEGNLQKIHGQLQAKKTGFEVMPESEVNVPPSKAGLRNIAGVSIGETVYDLQANASDNSRLINLGNGELFAGWTIAKTASGWPDRGTGYNSATGGVFGPVLPGLLRLEGATRTGFPTLGALPDGTRFSISHTGAGGLNFCSLAPGATEWTNKLIPSANAHFWARSAVSGNTIHVIALTTPVGNGGTAIDGVDGLLHYWRSPDGGATWDKQDVVVAGADYNKSNDGEGYAIDATGNTVAIVLSSLFTHVSLTKSTDGGNTWKREFLYKFPIEFYEGDLGYDSTQIDTALSLDSDINSVFTSDAHVAVRVDNNGKVHAAYGAFYFNDADGAVTAGFNWFPAAVGTVYWNDDMGYDTDAFDGQIPGVVLDAPIDLDGDGTWNVNLGADEYNDYGITAVQSMPTIGLGSNNTVYVGISLVDERYKFADNSQALRHNYLFKNRNGEGFGAGLDITVAGAPDPTLTEFVENAFPFLAKDCSDKVHIIWQEDFKPGSDVTDATPAAEIQNNSIIYSNFQDSEIPLSAKDLLSQSAFTMTLMPNPAADMLQVQLDFASKAENVQVLVVDMNGRQVMNRHFSNLQNDRIFVPVSTLPNGTYALTIRTEQGVAAKKFTVLH